MRDGSYKLYFIIYFATHYHLLRDRHKKVKLLSQTLSSTLSTMSMTVWRDRRDMPVLIDVPIRGRVYAKPLCCRTGIKLVGFCDQTEFFGWVLFLAGKPSPNRIVTGIPNGALMQDSDPLDSVIIEIRWRLPYALWVSYTAMVRDRPSCSAEAYLSPQYTTT